MKTIVMINTRSSALETRAKELIKKNYIFYSLDDSSASKTLYPSIIKHLFRGCDYALRKDYFELAKKWSGRAGNQWHVVNDKSVTLWQGIELNDFRININRNYLERVYLLSLYLELAIKSNMTERVLIDPTIIQEERITIERVSHKLRCVVEKSLKSIGCDSLKIYAYFRNRRKIWRDYCRTFLLFFSLPFRMLQKKKLPSQSILFEAFSIQSVRNTSALIRPLAKFVPRSFYIGIRTNMLTQGYEHYDIAAISQHSEFPLEATGLDLLSYLPLIDWLSIPLLFIKSMWAKRSISRKGQSLALAVGEIPVKVLKTDLLRQFNFDLIFVMLCFKAWKNLINNFEPRLLVVSDPTSYRGRILANHKVDVPTVMLQDGTIDNSGRYRDLEIDFCLVWGSEFRKIMMENFGLRSKQISIIGSEKTSLKTSHNEKYTGKVLFCSQPVEVDSVSFYEKISVLEWMREAAIVYKTLKLIVRPHPRENVDDLTALVRQVAGDSITVSDCPSMEKEMENAGIVVSIFSTTIYEAMSRAIASIVVDCGYRANLGFFEETFAQNHITEKDSFLSLIGAIHEDVEFRKAYIKKQTETFSQVMSPAKSKKEVCELLMEMTTFI